MANVRNSSKSGLFLIELIIAIVFFALTSAVCVQLFVQSYLVSKQSSETTTAIIEARNAVECFRAAGGSDEKLRSLLGAAEDGAGYAVFYDGDWQPTSARENASFELLMDIAGDGGLNTAHVSVCRMDGTVIYQLSAKSYTPEA